MIEDWKKKGATISLDAACKAYGVDMAFINSAIQNRFIEYHVRVTKGRDQYFVLKSQMEWFVNTQFGWPHLEKLKKAAKLKEIRRKISYTKRELVELQKQEIEVEKELAVIEQQPPIRNRLTLADIDNGI